MADTTHECPGGDCKARVPSYQLACKADWRKLPVELQKRINAAFGRNRLEHRKAVAEAVAWYRENT